MKRVVPVLAFLAAGCGLSAADRALLDAPMPVDVNGAWVVLSTRNPENGWGSVLVVERDGRAKSVSRMPDFESSLQAALINSTRKVRAVEEVGEGVATPDLIAELKAALKSPPRAAGDPSFCWNLVVRDDPGEAPRRLTFDLTGPDGSGYPGWHPLPHVLYKITAATR